MNNTSWSSLWTARCPVCLIWVRIIYCRGTVIRKHALCKHSNYKMLITFIRALRFIFGALLILTGSWRFCGEVFLRSHIDENISTVIAVGILPSHLLLCRTFLTVSTVQVWFHDLMTVSAVFSFEKETWLNLRNSCKPWRDVISIWRYSHFSQNHRSDRRCRVGTPRYHYVGLW